MNKFTINEGVIQVPPYLLKESLKELMKHYIRYIYDIIPDREAYKQLTYQGKPLPVISDAYRLLGMKDNDYNITEIEYDHSEVKYSDEDGTTHFKLAVTLTDGKTTKGAYSITSNAIVFFMKPYTDEIREEMWIFDNNYFDEDEQGRQEILDTMMFKETIEHHIEELYKSAKGTIHHELAHMIQYQYLKDKDEKQVSGSKETPEEYYSGNVEFSPHILSAIDDFETFVEAIDPHKIDKYRYDLFKIMTALTNKRHIFYDDYSDEKPKNVSETQYTIKFINHNRNFFEALKSKNEKKYRKAVKYLMNELKKRNVL